MRGARGGVWLLLLGLASPCLAQPQVSIRGGNPVIEGNSGTVELLFTVAIEVPAARKAGLPITINYRTVDGTATAADGDFVQETMGTIVCDTLDEFCPSIRITVNGDTKVEDNEQLFVELTSVSPPAVIFGDGTASGVILDDGDTTTVSIGDTAVAEGGPGVTTGAMLPVTLTNPSAFPVTVEFAARDGTASSVAGDYEAAAGEVLFAPGSVSEMVRVDVNGDDEIEPDEFFFVDLTNPEGADLGDSEGRATITNDDVPTLSIDDVAVTEGDGGTVDAVFTVTLSTSSTDPVTVDFATRDGGATSADADYQAGAGSLLFAPGSTSETIVIAVNGDLVVEPDESFFVDLSAPVGATVADGEGTGTIRNDDAALLSIDDAAVTEGNGGTVDAVFTVSLSRPSATAVTVGFATRDATATTGSGDYQAAGGQLSFAPGSTSQTIAVAVNGDLLVEPEESFFVDLSAPAGAALADAEGEGTIRNDDGTALSIDDVAVIEGSGGTVDAVFTVTLSQPSATPVTVDFATRDGTAASADGDYGVTSGQLTFSPGATTRTLAVAVNGDALVEPDETFFVDLDAPVGATLGDGVGEGTIRNDDGAALTIEDATTVEGDEGTTDVVLTVSLSASSASQVTVDFTTRDASATVGDADYRRTSGRLVFPPGARSSTLTLAVVGDRAVEPDEIFLVDLSNPMGATIADGRGRVTIENDDRADDEIRLLPAAAVNEGAGSALVTAVRSGSGEGAASVTVATRGGSAVAGEDFRSRTRVLRWSSGETGGKTFEVRLIDDNVQEPDEKLVVALSAPSGAVLGAPAETELTITDDDRASGLEGAEAIELTASVGDEIELEVRVIGDDGAAIAGATVVWEVVEGDAELVDGASATSDADGRAAKTVRLGASPGAVTVSASLAPGGPVAAKTDGAATVVFEITVEGDLEELFNPGTNPAENSVAEVLDESCRDAGGSFGALCDFVFELDDEGDQRDVVRELTPREVVAQGDVTLAASRAQFSNVGSRLAALRGGATGESVDQLALGLGGKPVPVAVLASAFTADRFESGLLDRVDAAVAALDSNRRAEGPAEEGVVAAIEPEDASRWGFFLNGQASFGDSPATEIQEGFDLDTHGLTAGLDYRVSDRLVVGGALGYLDLRAELDRDGGSLDSRGVSLSAYTSYFRQAFYLDAILSYGTNDFDLIRHVDLPQPFEGRNRFTALGAADGDQLAFAAGAGYDAVMGAATIGGFGRVSWVDARVDGYSETGAGPFNLAIRDQKIESLLLEAGVEYTRAVSRRWGVLQPTVRASALRELEDASRLVRGSFRADPTANEFAVPTERPDRSYLNFGAGLTAITAHGRSFYLFYDTDLARDDLEIYTLSFGFRLEL